jgi:hypothetical protein
MQDSPPSSTDVATPHLYLHGKQDNLTCTLRTKDLLEPNILKNNTQTIVDHKFMIFGESHARGPSSNVKNNLDDNYSGCGFVRPEVNIATQIFS